MHSFAELDNVSADCQDMKDAFLLGLTGLFTSVELITVRHHSFWTDDFLTSITYSYDD